VTLAALVGVTVLVVLVAMAVAGYLIDRDAGRRESGRRQ
jgi:UPF0716 family protein affecting phage T7 exclusion